MQSPQVEATMSNGATSATSSMTLPEYSNGWGSSSSEDSSNHSSQTSSTHDELIGSPPRSVISTVHSETSGTESQSQNTDFDQDTVISVNNRTLTEDPLPTKSNNPSTSSASPPDNGCSQENLELQSNVSESDSAFSIQSQEEADKMKKIITKLRCDLELERDAVIQLRRKVTQANKEKVMQSSNFNEEMSLLKYENVALQARLEEQTVHTEQLEYELTKVKKKYNQDLNFAEQREAQDTKQITDYKAKVEEAERWLAEAQVKLASLDETSSASRRESAEELHKLKLELQTKDSQLTNLQQETDINKSDNSKLTEFIKEQEGTLKEMLEKMESTETELKSTAAELETTKHDLSTQKSLTDEQALLLQDLQEKCKSLTSVLDEERSSSETRQSNLESLETKSVHLECSLNDEKAVSGELRSTLEQLRRDLHQLEDKYGKQCREFSETHTSLNRAEQELDSYKRHLHTEKEDKRDLVNKLKKQLDIHQEHLKKLKSELTTTNKHQKYLEEIAQKIVNDLQPVFQGFPCESGEITAVSLDKISIASSERTRNVFDTLNNTVTRYKSRLTTLADEKAKAKAQADSLTKEASTYKEMLYKKEKAFEECQTELTDARREMDRVSRESSETEAKCATMTVDLEAARAHNETLQAQCQTLKHEMLTMKSRYDKEIDEKHMYLQRIYHLLTSDLDMTFADSGQVSTRAKLTWSELSTTVSERVSSVINELSHLRSRVTRLDDTLSKNESYIETLRDEHNENMNEMNRQIASAVEKNSLQWREERDRLEQHYSHIMNENVNRQQIYKEQLEKSKRDADDVWDRLKETDESNRTLESEKCEFQEKAGVLERQQRALLCALALISGSYFPLLNRSRQLREQRNILMQQYKRFAAFKTQIGSMLETLVAENGTPQTTPRGSLAHRLRFRKLVLAVLAANRLRRLGKVRRSVSIRDGETQNNLQCWMTADCNGMQKSIDKLTKEKADREAESALQQQEMTRLRAEIQRMQQEINRQHEVIHRGGAGVGGGSGGVKEQDVCGMINDAMQTKILAPDDYLDVSEGHLVQWLSHMDLESVASSSTRDLLDTLDKLHQDGSVGPSQVSSVVTSTLTKLIRQLSVLYTCEESSIRDRHHYSHSMIDLPVKLARGLHHSLVRVTLEEQLHVAPSQMMVTSLQEKVLSFIQQLHTSESERKRLRDNMDNMNQNINQLTQYQEACADLERELYGLRKQMERLVPGERVEEVMSELNQALDKERRAQALLSDQSMQIKQLTARMDMDTSDRDHNEQSLKFAVKQLNEELEKKTTQLSNLTRQVSGLENERRSIHDNIYDAESALKTAAQDRQTLSNYVETLSLAFNKCLSEGGQSDLSRVLLSGELIPSGRAAPDLLCVQKLVHAFIDSHSALQAKISALHSLTTEQLNEITRLKQEMTLVCTGQKTHTPNSNQVYSYPSSGYSSLSPLKLPLTDNSSLNTPPTNYDSGLMTRSMPRGHRNGVDNPSYPRPASKDNLIRGRDTLDNQLNYQNGLDSQPYPRSSSNHQSYHRSASSHYPLPPSQLSMDRMSSSVRGVPSPRLQMAGNIRR